MTDFTITREGGLSLLHPHTPDALQWVAENIGEPDENTLFWGGAPVIEHRYLPPILEGIYDAGLTVEVDL